MHLKPNRTLEVHKKIAKNANIAGELQPFEPRFLQCLTTKLFRFELLNHLDNLSHE